MKKNSKVYLHNSLIYSSVLFINISIFWSLVFFHSLLSHFIYTFSLYFLIFVFFFFHFITSPSFEFYCIFTPYYTFLLHPFSLFSYSNFSLNFHIPLLSLLSLSTSLLQFLFELSQSTSLFAFLSTSLFNFLSKLSRSTYLFIFFIYSIGQVSLIIVLILLCLFALTLHSSSFTLKVYILSIFLFTFFLFSYHIYLPTFNLNFLILVYRFNSYSIKYQNLIKLYLSKLLVPKNTKQNQINPKKKRLMQIKIKDKQC